jgi:hypothetical protein
MYHIPEGNKKSHADLMAYLQAAAKVLLASEAMLSDKQEEDLAYAIFQLLNHVLRLENRLETITALVEQPLDQSGVVTVTTVTDPIPAYYVYDDTLPIIAQESSSTVNEDDDDDDCSEEYEVAIMMSLRQFDFVADSCNLWIPCTVYNGDGMIFETECIPLPWRFVHPEGLSTAVTIVR